MKQEATVTKKGQVTIPKVIRDKLGLKKGKKVYFELRGKEAVMLPEVEDPLEELRQLRKEIVPVTSGVAKYAADLRDKYYQKGERELSYRDFIHLATAILAGCKKLYSGDPDFENIGEMNTEII